MLSPSHLTSYKGPSSSSSVSSSESYDYSGLDDALKKQDELGALRTAKFGALYGGDIPGSVQAAHRIRGLVEALRPYAADVSELHPSQVVAPLSRVSSASSSSDHSSHSPQWDGTHEDLLSRYERK
jgi:hypothetical protein